MTPKEQLDAWVKGENLHNHERDECCPDFACCQPNNHWPPLMRKRFAETHAAGGSEACIPMLLMGLSGALLDQPVHVAGMMENSA